MTNLNKRPLAKPTNRRRFLSQALVGTACAAGALSSGMQNLAFAQAPGDQRLVFVMLRGAMDGLASLVPVGDPNYLSARQDLAIQSGLVPLDSMFALSPGLAGLAPYWQRGEMIASHAVSIPLRTRSHFDAQAVLETGLGQTGGRDGWINRLLGGVNQGKELSAIAMGEQVPLMLTGSQEVASWSPSILEAQGDSFMNQLAALYANDTTLGGNFAKALELRGQAAEGMMQEMTQSMGGPASRRRSAAYVQALAQAAGQFLSQPDGPRIATLELGGWDTHANQGSDGGQLANRQMRLVEAIDTLRENMASVWDQTTIVVMTEFGRTVEPNGTGGTDHGTGGAAFIIGGQVRGGQLVGDWPGLAPAQRWEGRDLYPANDSRALLSSVIAPLFDLTATQISRDIFPGLDNPQTFSGLLRIG